MLATPSVEKRRVAAAAKLASLSPSARTSGSNAPSHAPAARRCAPSAARWIHPPAPRPLPPWPIAASATSISADAAPPISNRGFFKKPIKTKATTTRADHTRPNWVCVTTVPSVAADSASRGGSPLIEIASRASHAAALARKAARLQAATRRKSDAARASGETKSAKANWPKSTIAAAKCTARTIASGRSGAAAIGYGATVNV